MPKRIIGNPTTTPMAMPDIDARIVKTEEEGNRAYGRHDLVPSITYLLNGFMPVGRMVESYEDLEIVDTQSTFPNVDVVAYMIDGAVKPKPITKVPTTLWSNEQYNFGEVTELALAFPTVANDGDVIYATFITGETATALTIDTTNTCDIEFVPEPHTGYEVFGKFNGSIWIVNYSEYTVSEG